MNKPITLTVGVSITPEDKDDNIPEFSFSKGAVILFKGTKEYTLLVAAPDLLAACKHALDKYGGVRPDEFGEATEEYDMLRAAVDKAMELKF